MPNRFWAKRIGNDDSANVDLMLFDRVIVFDHYKQKLILIAGVDAADPERSTRKPPKSWMKPSACFTVRPKPLSVP